MLETPRLLLRRWRQSDVEPMAAMNADAEVMRWIGSGTIRTPDQTKTAIDYWEKQWDTQGYGLFAVEVKETRALAGFVGLSVPSFLPEVMPAVEIGWRLGRAFWGQGFATEAAQEALKFGFYKFDLTEILGIFQVGNHASERIMQKLGMHMSRETLDPTCGRPVRVYAIASPITTAKRDGVMSDD